MKNKRDYSQFYQQLTGRIRESDAACFLLRASGKAMTAVMYGAYPLLLILLGIRGETEQLIRTILVPGLSFVLLTVIRAKINRPRPYETWNIDPIIHKDTRGNSMPSRHVFSSAVIAMAWFPVSAAVGTVLMIIAAAAAWIRVMGGVHYPSDVAAGLLSGVAAGIFMVIFW